MKVDPHQLRTIAKRYGLDLIVLFGSSAKGRANANSDLDIAVRARDYRKSFPRYDSRFRLVSDLRRALRTTSEVDLVVLNRAESLLMRSVVTEGAPLYQRTGRAWLEFVSYANRRYYDDEHYYRGIAEYLRRRYR